MLNEPTVEKLRTLRLDAMADAWTQQRSNLEMAGLSFDERFGLLIDAEWLARENKRLTRLLRDAKLRLGAACVEDIDYAAKRELDKAVVRQLATCRWVQEHQNVLITGATGTGKTVMAALDYARLREELAARAPHVHRASTIGRWRRSKTKSAATCSTSWRTATAIGRRS